MGFNSGIYIAEKNDKFNNEDYLIADSYYSWDREPVNKKNYITFCDYTVAMNPWFKDITEERCSKCKDYAIKNEKKDEFGSPTVFKTVESWCSDGWYFHTKISSIIKDNEITKDNVFKIINWVLNQINNNFKHIMPERSFIIKDEDNDIIESRPCDGIEVVDEDGSIERIYNYDSLYESTLYKSKFMDISEYNACTRLLNAMIFILENVDFDKQIVIYEGSN